MLLFIVLCVLGKRFAPVCIRDPPLELTLSVLTTDAANAGVPDNMNDLALPKLSDGETAILALHSI